MRPAPIPGKISLGVVVNHTDEDTEKYLPAKMIVDKVLACDAALGRESAFVEIYNEAGAGLTFPTGLFAELRKIGKVPCLQLWPNDDDFDGEPNPEHSLNALASGAGNAVLQKLAEDARNFGSPVIIAVDEPSGFLWSHPSQGGGAADTLDDGNWPKGPAQFVRFWRHLHSVVKSTAPNVTLAIRYVGGWNAGGPDDWRRPEWWWPGAGYVDEVWVNALAYAKLQDGPEVWPMETSPGDVWTPQDSYQDVLNELSPFLLPGAESLPWGVGFGGSEHPGDVLGKGLWLSELLIRIAANPKFTSGSLWADDSYLEAVDPTKFPRTASAIKKQYQKPRFSSQMGVA